MSFNFCAFCAFLRPYQDFINENCFSLEQPYIRIHDRLAALLMGFAQAEFERASREAIGLIDN
jgi:hypothetical protein